MPAQTEKQRRFMRRELAKALRGAKRETTLTIEQLEEFVKRK